MQQGHALDDGSWRFRGGVGDGCGRAGKDEMAAGVAGRIRGWFVAGMLMAGGLVFKNIRGCVPGVTILGMLRGGVLVGAGRRHGKSRNGLQRQSQHQQQDGDCSRKSHGEGF